MRLLSCALALLLLAAAPLPAQKDQPKPNSLTPQEVADGWILLFDGETTFGWKIDGEAKVESGELVLGGKKATTATPTSTFSRECENHFECRSEGKERPTFTLTRTMHSTIGNSSGSNNLAIRSILPPAGGDQKGWHPFVAQTKYDPASQKNYLQVMSAGRPVSSGMIVSADLSETSIGFQVPAGSRLRVRNVRLKPVGLKPVFNGKDLTGWKEIPGKKSKFSVTKEGWLDVRDGSGDLQTEGRWDDFVLQLDVFSNGKHLNSGVFFRCVPGQFWSGYEAQIRNQWQGDDRTKPVDYGTGGLYNLQPARKVVSSDKEWFTMTVAAHGSHLAVWVNGYQTAG